MGLGVGGVAGGLCGQGKDKQACGRGREAELELRQLLAVAPAVLLRAPRLLLLMLPLLRRLLACSPLQAQAPLLPQHLLLLLFLLLLLLLFRGPPTLARLRCRAARVARPLLVLLPLLARVQ